MKGKTKPIVVGYIRVSTIQQKESADTQRFEILKLADEKKLRIDKWVSETVSGTKKFEDRELGQLLPNLKKGDVIIVSEISRLGRSLLDIMNLLHLLSSQKIGLITCKERFELADNTQSTVLSFAFGLAAEIERKLISQRTTEALARLKSQGVKLGRPKGTKCKSRLDGHEAQIEEMLAKRVSKASLARILGVHPGTLASFIITRKLKDPKGKTK